MVLSNNALDSKKNKKDIKTINFVSYSFIFRSFLAGTPATIENGSTSFVTTAPAPTIDPLPI